MMQGRAEAFAKRFLVMHFFNPVRYMKLLELVAGPEDVDRDAFERVRRFGEDVLGKGIVVGKDTPNFVGNRIGTHAMMTTIHLMLEDGLAPEDIDAITGAPMAHPKSASFRTADVVGLDTFVHVADNCYASLVERRGPRGLRGAAVHPGDGREEAPRRQDEGRLLQAAARRRRDRRRSTRRRSSTAPRAATTRSRRRCKALGKIEDPKERVRKLVADPGKAGKFAWKVLSRSLAYSRAADSARSPTTSSRSMTR